jgi:hypothetical protein
MRMTRPSLWVRDPGRQVTGGRNSKSGFVTAIGVLAMSLTSVAALASPAAAAPSNPASAAHCAAVLDKVRPGESESRILRRACASTPEGARVALSAATPGFAPLAATALMTWFEHAEYSVAGGGSSYTFYGNYGTCDGLGYSIPNITKAAGRFWHDRISSFKAYGDCNLVTLYRGNDYTEGGIFYRTQAQPHLDVPGGLMNDRADSLKVQA